MSRKDQRERNKMAIIEYLANHPCVDCSEADVRVLTFDHIKGKNANVSFLVNKGYSLERIFQEIKLCEVRCISCHVKIEEQRANTRRFQYWFEHQRPAMLNKILGKKDKKDG